jgi:hypothetical protein
VIDAEKSKSKRQRRKMRIDSLIVAILDSFGLLMILIGFYFLGRLCSKILK